MNLRRGDRTWSCGCLHDWHCFTGLALCGLATTLWQKTSMSTIRNHDNISSAPSNRTFTFRMVTWTNPICGWSIWWYRNFVFGQAQWFPDSTCFLPLLGLCTFRIDGFSLLLVGAAWLLQNHYQFCWLQQSYFPCVGTQWPESLYFSNLWVWSAPRITTRMSWSEEKTII